MATKPTVKIAEPVAKYLLALVFDPNMRSESLDTYVQGYLSRALFGDLGEMIDPADAPGLLREALQGTLWQPTTPA